ncbi:hypothetical protein SAMN02745823_03879 [Sporobacter termitidis DSM 10068]|uniref:Uncharacterized protein n=1 Tax=Sporobacter termitidis DSM 10068 TaxID=1123282 RepID=A0A1M5ZKF8_9FIRM|nr:hypothetical protein [Sporobacter termitidis]SHI24835.1 hypothetical protein SAMN02745823_03873 [Sporobacter termitidis DSM 10068]SHI24897.1 hypothetical protein SAMN02745823_03879 [Sporobacter termitidis DSM 10068]
MTFTINGTDITPYIAPDGIKWQRSDVEGPNAGRAISGSLIRDRVAIKYRADITCPTLSAAAASVLLALLEPVWITVVTDTNPFTGSSLKTYTMYSNNISAVRKTAWTPLVSGITFPLIQK